MVEIRPLRQFDEQVFCRVAGGYRSQAKYHIEKRETPQQAQITFELVPLAQEYVKAFTYSPADLEHYRSLLELGFSWGAYDGDRLVGLALAEPHTWNRSLWVWEFHVAEPYRGQSIGRRLMEAAAQQARQAGLRILVCETQNTNPTAMAVYRRLGFELEGVDLSYYTNDDLEQGEVAIFMKRKL